MEEVLVHLVIFVAVIHLIHLEFHGKGWLGEEVVGEEAEGTGGTGTGAGTSPRRNGLDDDFEGVRRIVASPFEISE